MFHFLNSHYRRSTTLEGVKSSRVSITQRSISSWSFCGIRPKSSRDTSRSILPHVALSISSWLGIGGRSRHLGVSSPRCSNTAPAVLKEFWQRGHLIFMWTAHAELPKWCLEKSGYMSSVTLNGHSTHFRWDMVFHPGPEQVSYFPRGAFFKQYLCWSLRWKGQASLRPGWVFLGISTLSIILKSKLSSGQGFRLSA